MEKDIFANFEDYWFYTKHLTHKQRQVIRMALPKKQQARLKDSYKAGGWNDLFMRNQADDIVENIKKEFGCDLVSLRASAIHGRNVYIKKNFWETVNKRFKGFSSKQTYHIFGGLKAVEADSGGPDEFRLIPI
jgi:hypothetical protein